VDFDLTPFYPLLKALGPWGWLAAGVLWFIQFRRTQSPNVPSPNTPSPADPMDDLMTRLRDRLKNVFPNLPFGAMADADPSQARVLVAQRDELNQKIDRKREELTAQIQALNPKG
jgi:hypothetical protein